MELKRNNEAEMGFALEAIGAGVGCHVKVGIAASASLDVSTIKCIEGCDARLAYEDER